MSLPVLSTTVRDWLAGQALPHRLAVGFSGGADSTALLLTLAQCGHQVVAWHVDHAWDEGSADIADILQRRVASWDIEFHRARLSAPSGKNREAEARQGRFEQFSKWASSQKINTLCLAHHCNDQAETVYMRLLQGAGPAGCSGMRYQREYDGLFVIRPLLQVARREIVETLRDAGVNWYEDASNKDTSLLRNRIRRRLFPTAQAVGNDPVALFLRWQVQAALLQQRLNDKADAVRVDSRNGVAVVDWHVWYESPASIRAVVLQRMNARVLGAGAVLGRRHIELAEIWRSHGGRAGIDLSRCRLFRDRENLHLAPVPVSLSH